ncbi:MAG: hypothetical protein HDQ96_11100 [Lachnospiraceae bacterium]|nr:hypothetical protein [Lachnospiraceae bacterium]
MYPENRNPDKGKYIAIGIIVSLVFIGLFAGCIAVVMQYVELSENGKLDRWLEANSSDDDNEISEYGYYDEDGYFHYYGETDQNDGFGYYDEDGEFHYFAEETDPKERFNHSTHDEDIEGYATGEYFSFPADNRVEELAYSVEIEEKEYQDGSATYIYYNYPVVKGDVPNLDYINDTICAEWESLLEFYEEDYKAWLPDYYGEDYKEYVDDDGIMAQLDGCVTYMSEDILSVVYRETVYYGEFLDYDVDLYLYCLNFDMKNGQLLENTGMLDIDKEFAEEFRERSVKQNADSVLDYYDDEDVMYYLENSDNLILFYCPQGMEIGINVDSGWVTVTYPDYEEYLKKF